MTSVADLTGIPLFSTLSADELAELATWFEARSVSEGVRLATEGAAGYSFFVLVEGSAEVTLGGEAVATYEPGDFFGEMAIAGDGRRTATVTTTSPVRILTLFGTEFRRLQQAQPAIAARLESAIQQRRQELLALRPDAGESP